MKFVSDTFRVDGHLFRVADGVLQYFEPNFPEPILALNGLEGRKRHGKRGYKTYKIGGYTFQLAADASPQMVEWYLQYYRDLAQSNLNGIEGVDGLWKSIKNIGKKVFKGVKKVAPYAIAATGAYYGYQAIKGGNVPMPTPKTVENATAVAATLLTSKVAAQQAALQNKYQTMPVQTALTPYLEQGGNISADAMQQGFLPAGYTSSIDTKTLLLLGGGALVLLFALRK